MNACVHIVLSVVCITLLSIIPINQSLKIFDSQIHPGSTWKLFYHKTAHFGPVNYNISGKLVLAAPTDNCNLDQTIAKLQVPQLKRIRQYQSIGSLSYPNKQVGDTDSTIDESAISSQNRDTTSNTDPINQVANPDVPQVYKNQIVLISRGNCTFAEKSYNAELLGAAAVIIGNFEDSDSDEWVIMYKEDTFAHNITIPIVFIPYNTHQWLSTTLKSQNVQSNGATLGNSLSDSRASSRLQAAHEPHQKPTKRVFYAMLDAEGEYQIPPNSSASVWVTVVGSVVLILPAVWCCIVVVYFCRKLVLRVINRIRRHKHLRKIPIIRYKGTRSSQENVNTMTTKLEETAQGENKNLPRPIENRSHVLVESSMTEDALLVNSSLVSLKGEEKPCMSNRQSDGSTKTSTSGLDTLTICKNNQTCLSGSCATSDCGDSSMENTPRKSLLSTKHQAGSRNKRDNLTSRLKLYENQTSKNRLQQLFEILSFTLKHWICAKLMIMLTHWFETSVIKMKACMHSARDSIFMYGHKQPHNDSCAICLDDFQLDERIKLLPCCHGFHPNCIDPWLKESSELCPMCKQSIFKGNSDVVKQNAASDTSEAGGNESFPRRSEVDVRNEPSALIYEEQQIRDDHSLENYLPCLRNRNNSRNSSMSYAASNSNNNSINVDLMRANSNAVPDRLIS